MARKYSKKHKEAVVRKVTEEGRPAREVADEAGISPATLRRWLKALDGSGAENPAGRVVHVLVLDQEKLAPKIERILRNEGHRPLVVPLSQHRLAARLVDDRPWRSLALVFELAPSAAARLIDLIQRSGRDVPFLAIGHATRPLLREAVDCDSLGSNEEDHLNGALGRLYTRLVQRTRSRDCHRHFEQLQRCCYKVFDAAAVPILILNADAVLYANSAYLDLLGYADFAAVRAAGSAWLRAGPLRSALEQPIADSIIDLPTGGTLVAVTDASGRALELQAEALAFPGISQAVLVLLRPAVSPARHDPPAGFCSRSEFLHTFGVLVRRERAAEGALFYVDVLGQKRAQRAIGYANWDGLMEQLGNLLMQQLPAEARWARFESGSLVALVPGGDGEHWTAMAQAFHGDVTARTFDFGAVSLRVQVAIGIADLAGAGANGDGEALIRAAAEAAGSREQRGGVALYTDPGAREGIEGEVWRERVVNALRDENLFSVVYQPIVNLAGESRASYEALLRLHNEGGGEYLPGTFLPVARQAGLMGVVDHWGIRRALKAVHSEGALGTPIRLFLNVSRESLLSDDFCAWLARLLADTGTDPASLVFEVPEAEMLRYAGQCQGTLSELRALGCAIALDHFTGRDDSFDLLDVIPVDFVKLDAAFTVAAGQNAAEQARLSEVVSSLSCRGKQTIACCVQDAESIAALWRGGVNYVQGYFLQQPSKALDYDFLSGDCELTAPRFP